MSVDLLASSAPFRMMRTKAVQSHHAEQLQSPQTPIQDAYDTQEQMVDSIPLATLSILPDPVFPVELERVIFEDTAVFYPAAIPALLCVARRVFIWIEPFLFRIIRTDRKPLADAVLHAMKAKPASFFDTSVRHVYFKLGSHSTQWTETEACALLSLCPRLHSFGAVAYWSPAALPPILNELHAVRRFSGCLDDIFGHALAVDLKLPFFQRITHMDVFENFGDVSWNKGRGGLQICADLAGLPALTHLCVHRGVHEGLLNHILKECVHLKVLMTKFDVVDHAREHAAAIQITDGRYLVVVTGTDEEYWADWERGARGGMDFWAAADEFVARKRNGEISASSYLLDHW
ncbi:hypothetical protein MSAN_00177600 [Mycena sanguinolenta]|uniref:Uncharacterized protein n=1 Tax=Mycena sanguinolenta TaxID=230812 RepID=A0A8H6ZEI1_9AGAR|nr:hypothetical protein MSAN_00177600 [Mycena sanguinolenta]